MIGSTLIEHPFRERRLTGRERGPYQVRQGGRKAGRRTERTGATVQT